MDNFSRRTDILVMRARISLIEHLNRIELNRNNRKLIEA